MLQRVQEAIPDTATSVPPAARSHRVPGMDATQPKINKGDLLPPTVGKMRGHHLYVFLCSQLLEHTKGTAFQGEK